MNKEEQFKTTIKAYTLTGMVWALVGTFAGLLNQLQIFTQWPSSDAVLMYGYLKPMVSTMMIYGAGLSIFMGMAYYILRKQHGVELKMEGLSLAGFGLHQLALVLGIMTIASGGNDGREFGEMPWISDTLMAISLVIFLLIAKSTMKHVSSPSRAMMFSILGVAGGLIAYFLGNFGLPYSVVSSAPLFSGFQDNAVQEFLRAGVYGFFIVIPVFAALFQFVPEHINKGLYSGDSANFQMTATMILVPLSGAAALAFTSTPVLSQTVGLVASIALTVTILMGVVNVQNTVAGSSSDTLTSFFKFGSFLVLIVAALRSFSYTKFFQEMFGYSLWNMADLNVDMSTYGILILSAAAYIMMMKISGREMNGTFAGLHLLLLLVGAILILVGNIGGGIVQSSAMSGLTEDGGLAMQSWADVMSSSSSVMSVYGLSLLGYLAVFLGMSVATYNIMTVQAEVE